MLQNPFTLVFNAALLKARVCNCHTKLIFTSKAGAYPNGDPHGTNFQDCRINKSGKKVL